MNVTITISESEFDGEHTTTVNPLAEANMRILFLSKNTKPAQVLAICMEAGVAATMKRWVSMYVKTVEGYIAEYME